jgi:hypothetical protein
MAAHTRHPKPGSRREDAVLKLLLVGVVALTAMALAACSGGGSADDEYFAELESLVDDVGSRVQIGNPPDGNGMTFEEARRALADYYSGISSRFTVVVDEIAALDPPDEAQIQHNTFVAALRKPPALFDDFAEHTLGATSVDEVRAVIDVASIDAAFEGVVAACFELETLARDGGNSVDLGCDS